MISGRYSMAKGYQRFIANYNVPGNPEMWNNLWNCWTMPKIDMFNWSLLHGRILTGENLEKRRMVGPFRCPLCAEASETISHLFLKCPYAISMWREVLKRWGDGMSLPDHIQSCFLNWGKRYQGELEKKRSESLLDENP